MAETLSANERRVLGVLMEKAMTQPETYPMTANAITSGCNQKQNRDPVMSLDEDTVWDTLEALRERGLVTVVLPGPGARTKRFRHAADEHYRWQPRERAVMTELLLRGPQTVGELRQRCSRMMNFESLDAITAVLECLAQYDPPYVAAMPREPGRSAIRHTHLLYPENEQPQPATGSPTGEAETPAQPLENRADQATFSDEIADLREEVADLRRRLETIERLME